MGERVPSTGPELDRLVGRHDEFELIEARLDEARLVSITGPGGIGKTRLARAIVDARRRQAGEAWFFELAAVTDPGLVVATVATTLHNEGDLGTGPLEAVRGALGDRNALVVLDNVEQIEGASGPIGDLLRACPGMRILTTSRTPVGLRGEAEVALEGLELPDSEGVEELEASSAGRLFLDRARSIGRLASVDEQGAGQIRTLLGRLDGLPLAIELAAARMRVLSPAELLERLEQRGIGAVDSADDPASSLAGIIDWTRALLAPGPAELLEAASVSAGFDVAMAEVMCPAVDVIDALDSLISLGLVRRVGEPHVASRFQVLAMVRTHVRSSLEPHVVDRYRDGHAAAVRSVIERHVTGDGRDPAVRGRLDLDADNIRLALDRLDETDPDAGLGLWQRLFYPFWGTRARLREGMARFESTAARLPAPTVALSRAMVTYAMNTAWVADEAAVRESMLRTLRVAREVDDRPSVVEVLAALGGTALNEADAELALMVLGALEEVDFDALAPSQQMRVAEARSHVSAVVHGFASDEALYPIREAARLAVAADRPRTETAIRGNLAIVHLHRREYGHAVAAASRSVELATEVGSPLLPWALSLLAMARAERGDVPGAVQALEGCVAETIDRGLTVQTGDTLLAAMPVARAAGHGLVAARLWGAAMALEASGATSFPPFDKALAEFTLERVRREERPLEVEFALRDGASADPVALLRSLPDQLGARHQAAASRTVLKHGELTKREIEILELVGRGRSDGEIAAALFISPKTASVHVANIKAKLGSSSRLEIALRARDLGLVEGPDAPSDAG